MKRLLSVEGASAGSCFAQKKDLFSYMHASLWDLQAFAAPIGLTGPLKETLSGQSLKICPVPGFSGCLSLLGQRLHTLQIPDSCCYLSPSSCSLPFPFPPFLLGNTWPYPSPGPESVVFRKDLKGVTNTLRELRYLNLPPSHLEARHSSVRWSRVA